MTLVGITRNCGTCAPRYKALMAVNKVHHELAFGVTSIYLL